MYFHHHSADDTTKALELARAGERVVETGGKEGYDDFDALRRKYKSEHLVQGRARRFPVLRAAARCGGANGRIGQEIFDFHTPFHYELRCSCAAHSTTPQLWPLGSDDLDAPSAQTAARIKSLIADGKDYTLAVYPGAEHGMTEYELRPDGTRVSTRFAPGYFAMMRDFIRDGRIGDHYGRAEITQPRVH